MTTIKFNNKTQRPLIILPPVINLLPQTILQAVFLIKPLAPGPRPECKAQGHWPEGPGGPCSRCRVITTNSNIITTDSNFTTGGKLITTISNKNITRCYI